jgi:hypothetical protein
MNTIFLAILATSAAIPATGTFPERTGFEYQLRAAGKPVATHRAVNQPVNTRVSGVLDTEAGTLNVDAFTFSLPATRHEYSELIEINYPPVPPTDPVCDAFSCTPGDPGSPARTEVVPFDIAVEFDAYTFTQPGFVATITKWRPDRAEIRLPTHKFLPPLVSTYRLTSPTDFREVEITLFQEFPISREISLTRDETGKVIDWDFLFDPIRFEHSAGPRFGLGSLERNSFAVKSIPEPAGRVLAWLGGAACFMIRKRR